MPLINFRAAKGTPLTYEEIDSNFGTYFYSSSLQNSGQTLRLHYSGSIAANVNRTPHDIALTSGVGTGTNRRVAFYTGSSALTTVSGFIVSGSSVGINLHETNDLPISHQLTVSGSIKASATVVQGSDKRLKDNITPIGPSLEKIKNVEGVTYTLKGQDEVLSGFIAQDIKEFIPEVVSEDNKGYLGVNYSGVIPYLVESIKELKAEIDELKSKI